MLVTTLLNSAKYPPEALSQLYFRRWAMELTLRNIKIILANGSAELQKAPELGT